VVYYDTIGDLIADILEKAHIQGADMWTLAREIRSMRVDHMGTGVIYYFPAVNFDHTAPQPEEV
jgi:predicted secreted protein